MPNTSPNMGLIVPIASNGVTGSGDTGPGYAVNISNDLYTTIDQHDHSSGKGVQITPAGININAALPLNGNYVSQAQAIVFQSQASTLATGTQSIQSVSVIGGNLYYNNSSGVPIQLTSGGSLLQGPTGPAGNTNVVNYFQAGVTGATAALCVATAMTTNGSMVKWNNPFNSNGTISQATAAGTGSSWINIGGGGLYEVYYNIQATGLYADPANGQAITFMMINATGGNVGAGGTAIPQSFSTFSIPRYASSGQNSYTGANVNASKTFIVRLASGTNLETIVQPNGGVVGGYAILDVSNQNNTIVIKQIGN